MRTKVLFLCIGNACRSQMAEAIANHQAGDVIEAMSAGLAAFGEIVPPTVAVLNELGVSTEGQYSKPLRKSDILGADLVINMSGRSISSIFSQSNPPVEDWDVGDPFGFDLAVYREIRDEIEIRVTALAERLREKARAAETA